MNKNKWALITGASSGLGLDFSDILAKRGMNLVVVARREDRLLELKEKLERLYRIKNIKVEVIAADLSAVSASKNLADEIDKREIQIEVLINNAGFGLYGDFVDSDMKQVTQMLNLDIVALTELTHIYAQKMRV